MSSRVTSTATGIYYLIRVHDAEFILKDSELQSEPGNALIEPLTKSDASRDQTRDLPRVIVHTDPNLFSLIHAHLKGFEIFPLSPQGVPIWIPSASNHNVYLGKEATLKNLLRDAEEFKMMKLYGKIRREMAGQIETPFADTGYQAEPSAPLAETRREAECRLFINHGGWVEWNEQTTQGTYISQATKEAILLKLIDSDITITGTSMPMPQGYRLLAAWDECRSVDDKTKNTKSFVLLESI